MNIDELKAVISECESDGNKLCVKNNLHNVLAFFKNNYSYNMLKSITAIDLGDEIELLYNLFSLESEEDAIISIKVKNEIESVADLFESA